jgi:tetratricopeptide (TPR) repeat protein
VLDAFLADELDSVQEANLDGHIRECSNCRARLDDLAKEVNPVPLASAPPALPQPLAQRLEESLSHSLEQAASAADRTIPPPDLPEYDIGEEIGRGGGGVVYRAMHLRLNRVVAIKVLHERTGAAQRERLRREALTLATIHHPGIVEVYEIGEAERRSYLVLEYVPGGSLSRFISATPQPPLQVARLMVQLASALHYAHSNGFIHRDLKPSNILLEEHFGVQETSGLDQFHPKITDFGVVKILDNDDGLTKTRDFVGTPSYMAPEQAHTAEGTIDERTDIYGLGTILYELLTGRPPFRSASPLDTLLQVRFDDPVPPRRLEPKVPRDLETICLKCLEKNPGRRYMSVRALQEDLQRFLEGRPVQARPVRWPQRTWRWCRRNPGWAAMIAVFASTLILAAIAGPLIAHRESVLHEEALGHQAAALREKNHARENLDIASQALEDTLGRVLHNSRLQESGLEEVRSDILRTAIPYLEQFVEREESDDVLRARQGRALIQLAVLHAKKNAPDKAREAFQRGLRIFAELNKEAPDLKGVKTSLASAHMEYGRFLFVNDKNPSSAKEHLRSALQIEEQLAANRPDAADLKDYLAVTLSLLGTLLDEEATGHVEAQTLMAKAIQVREQLVRDHPDQGDYSHYCALCHLNLALSQRNAADSQQALPHYQRAIELEHKLLNNGEVSLEAPITLSAIEGDYAITLAEMHKFDEAWVHLENAQRIGDALALANPSVVRYVHNAERSHDTALVMADQQNDPQKSVTQCRNAVQFFQRLKVAADGSESATQKWIRARLNLAECFIRQNRLPEASAECQAITSTLQPMLHRTNQKPPPGETLLGQCVRLAQLEERAGKTEEALAWLEECVPFLDASTFQNRANLLYHAHLGRSRCFKLLGKPAEAEAAAQKAQGARQEQKP